jgi:hypothetical protein
LGSSLPLPAALVLVARLDGFYNVLLLLLARVLESEPAAAAPPNDILLPTRMNVWEKNERMEVR